MLSVVHTKSHLELDNSHEYTGYQLYTQNLTQSWVIAEDQQQKPVAALYVMLQVLCCDVAGTATL